MGKKVDRLDTAFLFALGSIGLLISFIQVIEKDLFSLIQAVPFLFLGLALPFYVGYFRGAIDRDSMVERVRGWIYFFVGTMTYFAFFISSWLLANYPNQFLPGYGLILIYAGVLTSLSTAHAFSKWTRRVFRRSLSQYALSGTGLSAFSFVFFFTMSISLLRDYLGKDWLTKVTAGSTELLFWISITLGLFLIVLICEKASADAAEQDLPLPRFRKIVDFFIIRGLCLGTVLMECTFDFNLKSRTLWMTSYALWFIGCMFWVMGVSSMPQTFFITTILFALLAIISLYKGGTIRFVNIEKRTPEKVYYCLIVFCLTVAMIFSPSYWIPISLVIVLFTIIFLMQYKDHQPQKRFFNDCIECRLS